jgi:predicted 3-demethylubiquinone-9 3-methyltransferase (glyoxalase superfamily)
MKFKKIIAAVVLVGSLVFAQQAFCAGNFYYNIMNEEQISSVKIVMQQIAKDNN